MDRNVFDFRTNYIPDDVVVGRLAESWEQPDATTVVFNIRSGVHWHDKAPMNGRELTADDVVFNFHRYLGLGSGFTEVPEGVAAVAPPLTNGGITAVSADGNQVIFKLGAPNLDNRQDPADPERRLHLPARGDHGARRRGRLAQPGSAPGRTSWSTGWRRNYSGGAADMRQAGTIGLPVKTLVSASMTLPPFLRMVEM